MIFVNPLQILSALEYRNICRERVYIVCPACQTRPVPTNHAQGADGIKVVNIDIADCPFERHDA